MVQRKERAFRDFTLVELSHLSLHEIFEFHSPFMSIKGIKSTARTEIKRRLEFGKRIIDAKSKPGETVMIETPERFAQKHFRQIYGGTPVEKLWNEIMRDYSNFYHKLANYAKRKGRKVVSPEGGVTRPGSRLMQALGTRKTSKEIVKRAEFLMGHRRDVTMQRKIQARKPKLVIVALSHAIYLEHTIKPKKTLYYKKVSAADKKAILRERRKKVEEYYRLKNEKRKKAAKEKGLKFKRIKTPR